MLRVSEIFEFQKKSKIKAGEGSEEGSYPFFTSSVVQKKYLNKFQYQGECLIFGTGGEPSIHYSETPFSTSTDCLVLKLKDKNHFVTKFYYYYLKTHIHILERGFRGAGLKHISKSYISDIALPQSSLSRQKEVVNILDKVDFLLKKRAEQIDLIEKYLGAKFNEMFTNKSAKNWPEVPLEELAAPHRGSMRTGPFGSTLRHSEFVDKGISVLGIDNAVTNTFVANKSRFISKEKYQELKQYTVYPNDVLVTIMGTLGRSAVVPKNIGQAINTKHLACITLNLTKANPYFISYSVYSDPHILHQLSASKRGAIMDGLNLGLIKKIKIKNPPIDLQNRFESILVNARKIKEYMANSFDEMTNQFNSLAGIFFSEE